MGCGTPSGMRVLSLVALLALGGCKGGGPDAETTPCESLWVYTGGDEPERKFKDRNAAKPKPIVYRVLSSDPLTVEVEDQDGRKVVYAGVTEIRCSSPVRPHSPH